MATGYGLQFVRTLHGNSPIIEPFNALATYATALFVGDPVRLINTTGTYDAVSQLPNIQAAATGEIILGVVAGFEPDGVALVSGNYRAASTARTVLVNIDPDSVYVAQEDILGAPVTAAQIAALSNVNFIVAAGSTATGLSGVMVDSSTTTASAADLKIVGVKRDAGLNLAAAAAGAELEVMILAPAMKSTDSQS